MYATWERGQFYSPFMLEFFNKSGKWYSHKKESAASPDGELTIKQYTPQKENNYKMKSEATKVRMFVH